MNVINEGNRMPTGMSDYCSESPLHFRKKIEEKWDTEKFNDKLGHEKLHLQFQSYILKHLQPDLKLELLIL